MINNDFIDYVKNYLNRTLNDFKNDVVHNMPTKFYKYRKCHMNNINLLKEGKVCFSSPMTWNDKLDTTVNFNFEKFIEQFRKNPIAMRLKNVRSIMEKIEMMLNIIIPNSDKDLTEMMILFNDKGKFNNKGLRYIKNKFSRKQKEQYMKVEKEISIFLKKLESSNIMENIIDLNKMLRSNLKAFCLSENGISKSQWARYADEEKGFCIEYTFDANTDKNIMANLFPIKYGKKEEINPIDLLVDLICISFDYKLIDKSETAKKICQSILMKDEEWGSELEWRIISTANDDIVDFDYATSIILGKDISEDYKRELLNIARKKKLKVYQRRMNITDSDFITEEIVL